MTSRGQFVLDDVSRAIIEQLQEDGRRPYARIAAAVGLSEAAVRQRVQRLLDAGLVDIGRALDPGNDELFTWWAPWRNLRQRNIGWRIDYVLASTAQAGRAISSVSRRDYGTSDHAPLVVVFA